MSNKNSNVPYDQIPHIVINHPDTLPDHCMIMIMLFKILKDKKQCIYTNEKLSKNCKISLRTIERRISELNKMGFIKITGRGFNRRISLGLLFNNSATMAVTSEQNLDNSAKSANTTAKNDIHNRHGGGDSKNYTNPSTKDKKFSITELQEKAWYLKNPNTPIAEEHRYLFEE